MAVENHLIIGLGGTGGKILRSFRKAVYQNFRTTEPTNVNIRYLYVDSSDKMMAQDDPTWKILGTSVQLQQSSILKIAGLNLNSVLDNIDDHPGIAPWIGSREQLRAIVNSVEGADIVASQKRRLGRFLFACWVKQFRNQVQSLVKEMVTGGTADVTFHICCGLAGGTGSGSVVDTVCQIRALFPTKNYRILVYALLPERFPEESHLGPNYHANGYAALQELNALEVGSYKPWDLSWNVKGRLDLPDTFNCCYIFTDQNEDNNKFDVEQELPDILASFLFQKTVAAQNLEWATDGDTIKRQEAFEVGTQADEKELAPASLKPERTRRFFTFGTKQIVYPEEEIREYLTYLFALQASLQLQFNNWSDSVGFQNEPSLRSVSEAVRTPEITQRWQITNEHLLLSVGILPDEKTNRKWKPISAYWMGVLPNFKSAVAETNAGKPAVWLDELAKMCAEAFDSNYRDQGVQRFYQVKRSEIADHAAEIRRGIESDLYHDWNDGAKSMYDISRTLSALLKLLEEKAAYFDEFAVKSEQTAKSSEARVIANLNQWARVNPIGSLFGARRRLFDDQAQALQDVYLHRTFAVAGGFAKSLVQALVAEITLLAGEVNAAASMISSATAEFTKATLSRLGDTGEDDVSQQVIRFYNPAVVKAFGKSMVLNEEQQKFQTAAVRTALTEMLGDNVSFAVFNQRLNAQLFEDVLSNTCLRTATEAHDAIVTAKKAPEGVLKISVVDRLYKQYGANREALRGFVTKVVSRAKNFIVFDPAEVNRVVAGNENLGSMYSFSTIILPQAPDQADFRKVLEEEFKQARSGEKAVVSNPTRPNEITLINVTSAFPARFVADVAFLKEKYDSRVDARSGAQATFELHTEGDGSQFPSLFLRKVGSAEILPYLLLAQALKLVADLEDPDTGVKASFLLTRDQAGRDTEPVKLGKTFADAVENGSAMTFDALQTQVGSRLAQDYLHIAKRAELLTSVQQAVDAVKTDRPNPLDKTRQAYMKAERTVEDMLKKTTDA